MHYDGLTWFNGLRNELADVWTAFIAILVIKLSSVELHAVFVIPKCPPWRVVIRLPATPHGAPFAQLSPEAGPSVTPLTAAVVKASPHPRHGTDAVVGLEEVLNLGNLTQGVKLDKFPAIVAAALFSVAPFFRLVKVYVA